MTRPVTSARRYLGLVLGAGLLALVAIGAAALGPGNAQPELQALDPPTLVEQAATAGLEHAYDGGFDYYVGGGVAVFDCDDNGLLDVYVAGGSRPAALFRNSSLVGGELRLERRPAEETDLTGVTGAYPLDIDGDGVVDLAVLRRGENVLLRGLGDCRFERANEAWGFDGGDAWTTAFSAKWESDDAWPTLAVGNYLDEQSAGHERLCHDNELFRPQPAGDGYGPPTSLSPGWCTLSILFSDWDRSGRRDLRISNDRHYYTDYSPGQEQLWRVAAGEQPRAYTRDDGWQPLRIFGMGIASQDLTGDGYPEYFLTSQGDNKLQTLADGPDEPRYRDFALASGVTTHRPFTGDDQALASTAWHAEFADVNNDGLVDLFVAKGNVEQQIGYADQDPNNLLLGQLDGTFVEAADTAGIVHFARTRGAALADFNNDGMLDLIEVNRRVNVTLFRNVGWGTADSPTPMGNWLAISPRQAGANTFAIGAWVQLRLGDRLIEREVVIGGGHAGGQLGRLHFGLGRASSAEARVIWPDGTAGPWQRLAANQLVVVER